MPRWRIAAVVGVVLVVVLPSVTLAKPQILNGQESGEVTAFVESLFTKYPGVTEEVRIVRLMPFDDLQLICQPPCGAMYLPPLRTIFLTMERDGKLPFSKAYLEWSYVHEACHIRRYYESGDLQHSPAHGKCMLEAFTAAHSPLGIDPPPLGQ